MFRLDKIKERPPKEPFLIHTRRDVEMTPLVMSAVQVEAMDGVL